MRVQDASPAPLTLPDFSPGQSAAMAQGVTQTAAENLPGASIVSAVRQSQQEGMNIMPALRAGDYAGAASAFVRSTAAALGAIPGVHLLPGFAGIIQAYHGSPHIFDEFKLEKIGTGEGAQAYGHGLYFAENQGVARRYRDTLSASAPEITRGGKPVAASDPHEKEALGIVSMMASEGAEDPIKAALDEYRRMDDGSEGMRRSIGFLGDLAENGGKVERKGGALYSVKLDVNHEDLLDWDKPLSEQPAGVREKLAAAGLDKMASVDEETHNLLDDELIAEITPKLTGGELYRSLTEKLAPKFEEDASDPYRGWTFVTRGDEGQPAASRALHAAGIPGIRYLDAGSRGAGDGTRNVVIFDPSLISIESRNGQPIPTATDKASDGLQMLADPRAWGAQ